MHSYSLPRNLRGAILSAAASVRPRFARLRGRYLPLCRVVVDVGEEQRLVNPALEDRHAQLHALLDDLATLHAGFASELRGREMDCHQDKSSCEVCHVAPTVAPSPDVDNVNLLNRN